MSDLPLISDDVTDQMFGDIEKMTVELDLDPLEFGPKRLNQKVAETRDYLTQCEKLFVRVSHWLALYKRAHRAAQLDFDLAMQDMLANDPEVRAGRNVADRNAIATTKMRDRREELDRLSVVIQDLDALLAVIKSKRSDLKDVQGRLREQRQLCQEEIGLGSKWGSKSDGRVHVVSTAPVVDAVTMRDIDDLLNFSRSETDVSVVPVSSALAVESPSMAEVFSGTSGSQESLDALLDAMDPSPMPERVVVNDIDDLLKDLI